MYIIQSDAVLVALNPQTNPDIQMALSCSFSRFLISD